METFFERCYLSLIHISATTATKSRDSFSDTMKALHVAPTLDRLLYPEESASQKGDCLLYTSFSEDSEASAGHGSGQEPSMAMNPEYLFQVWSPDNPE